jgi:hypothetical protein
MKPLGNRERSASAAARRNWTSLPCPDFADQNALSANRGRVHIGTDFEIVSNGHFDGDIESLGRAPQLMTN